MEQPADATIVHGDTGHAVACLACARLLRQQRQPCPICRAPIDAVIRHFAA